MFFSPKDSDPQGRRVFFQSGLPFTGAYEPLGKEKPFFPTLTKIFLIVGLGFLSWLATYTGMLELIIANSGSVDVSVRIAMAFAVAMLMLMIIYLLDSLFSPISWWLRIVYVAGYVFLTLISVGFGFGFYWKFLESRSESTRSAESAVGQVQVALEGGQARLEQMQTTFDTLTTLSSQKAEQERTQGGTCPNSPPGDGPRRRLRDADAKNFSFAGDFVRQRAGTVKKDINGINREMGKLSRGDDSTIDPITGTRNVFLRGLNKKLDLTITRFNALRTDPQLRGFRDNFAARAQQTVFDNGRGGTFKCPDPQLQLALSGVVKAIDGLPNLDKPTISAVEGSEAIVEAFRRLTTSLVGALTFQLPPTPQELRALQQKAVRSVDQAGKGDPTGGVRPGLGEHDFIPFFIAIFVDLCLLLVSINRPVNRMQKLMASAQAARDAQVHQILTRVHTVHQKGRSQRLDALHEVMFDSLGSQYVAVPLDVNTGTINGTFGSQVFQQAYEKKIVEARYIATLMAALEAGGLVTPAPAMTQSRVMKKLDRGGSKFSDSTSFRVYRFVKGAWPAIVLDDMLGASAQLDAEARAHAAWEAEERRVKGPTVNFNMSDLGGRSDQDVRAKQEQHIDEEAPRRARNSRGKRKVREEPQFEASGREKRSSSGTNGERASSESIFRREPHFSEQPEQAHKRADHDAKQTSHDFVMVDDEDVVVEDTDEMQGHDAYSDVADDSVKSLGPELVATADESFVDAHFVPASDEEPGDPSFDLSEDLFQRQGNFSFNRTSDPANQPVQHNGFTRVSPVEAAQAFDEIDHNGLRNEVSEGSPPPAKRRVNGRANGHSSTEELTERVEFDIRSIAGRFNPNA